MIGWEGWGSWGTELRKSVDRPGGPSVALWCRVILDGEDGGSWLGEVLVYGHVDRRHFFNPSQGFFRRGERLANWNLRWADASMCW
jgi:hypothetical protein